MSNLLDTAYNRLDEAHRAWHIALKGYHHIDDFRAGINTAIQALRNITFALQKQKEKLLDFDNWYAGYREKMAKDPILKELYEARNVIVKQEDLKLHSTGTARTKGWIDYEKMVFSFDPMNDSYDIAMGFYNTCARHLPVSDEAKKRLVFQFERKWVYDKLPDFELLEALAHAYCFFFEMLDDAAKKFNLSVRISYATGDYCNGESSEKHKLKCMTITPHERSLAFSFNDGSMFHMGTVDISHDKVNLLKAKKRYGDDWKSKETLKLLANIFPESYPFDQMKAFAQVAVSSFKKDKYLVPISFIFRKENSAPVPIVHPFKDQEEKVMMVDYIASEIIKNRGTFLLTMCEIWLYNLNKSKLFIPTPKDTKNAREALQISYMSSETIRVILIPFHRGIFGEIVYSEPEIDNFSSDKQSYYIFKPLIEALKKVNLD